MVRLFCGFDAREAAGWHAFAQSVVENASGPVELIPLTGEQRDGSNTFTYERFLVPWHCGYKGFAIFMDASDMVCVGDVYELWEKREAWYAVMVVKHDYRTRHPRKYVGTEMEVVNRDYPRKNWSSVMLWDCGHYMNRCLTPEYVLGRLGSELHGLKWVPDERIGDLPVEWNWLADEYGENPEAKVLHWTAGVPGIEACRDAPQAGQWRGYAERAKKLPESRNEMAVAA